VAGDDVDANVVVEYALPSPCAQLPNMADHRGIGTAAAAETHHRAVTSLLRYAFANDRAEASALLDVEEKSAHYFEPPISNLPHSQSLVISDIKGVENPRGGGAD
jgi:hypothetical protein